MTLRIKTYIHEDKETTWDIGHKFGLTGEALRNFRPGYEHEIIYEVDETTGESKAIEIDGRKISD